MTKTLALAAALTLFAAAGAFAQADQAPQPSSGSSMTMQKGAAKSGGMTADDQGAAKPKAHHKMAKNDATENAAEEETTRQLNQQQAQYAQSAK